MNTRKRREARWSTLTVMAFMSLVIVLESPPACAQEVTTLIEFTNVWKYDQSGLELGIAWRTNDYDDSAWASGAGLLGFEVGLAPYIPHAPLLTPLTVSPAVTTFYFRTTFQWTGSKEGLSLFATNLVDDGCAIYLNGLQSGGVRMPTTFTAATLFAGGTEGALEVVSLAGLEGLRQGENLLAVEVHQASAASADIMFGMKLVAVQETPLVITNQPQSQLIMVGDSVTIAVGVSGGPVSYRWQRNGVNLNATGSSLTLSSVQPGNAGNYSVVCSNSLTVVTSSVATLTVLPDLVGPQVLDAIAENRNFGPRTINILFSEPIVSSPATSSSSARNTNNYTVTRLGTTDIIGVTNVLTSDSVGVLLCLDALDPNWVSYGDYVVTINNVADLKGNSIAPNTSVPVAWTYFLTNAVRSSQPWDFHVSAFFDLEVYDQPWFACDYSPGLWWGQGIGPFYGGVIIDTPCPTIDPPQTITGWQPEPILYRTTFSYPTQWPSDSTLYVRTAFDDGLVLYLNGIEIYRNNVGGTSGSLVHAALRASSGIGTASCITNLGIIATNLLPGSNCLAAAIVQAGGYAESHFVLEMDATVIIAPEVPLDPLPVLVLAPEETNTMRIFWSGAGFTLEASTNLNLGFLSYPSGPWTQVPQMSNPYLWNFTNGQNRFFRLRK